MLESELHKELFRKAYEQIVDAYTRYLPPGSRDNPEPSLVPEFFEACWAAECHRQFWKPADLKLVLVAESHVYTDSTDLSCTVARTRLPVAAAEAPLQFVRLIYCLAYGDNRLLEENCAPIQPNSTNTPFWSLFANCAGEKVPTTIGATWKVEVLMELQRRGIWLADASIHACMNPRFKQYRDNEKRVREKRRNIEWFPGLYRDVLRASWQYVSNTLDGCKNVWFVGKMVADNLPATNLDQTRWFYQPGVPLSQEMKKTQANQLERFRQSLCDLEG
jgi:hypothetical protein